VVLAAGASYQIGAGTGLRKSPMAQPATLAEITRLSATMAAPASRAEPISTWTRWVSARASAVYREGLKFAQLAR
jgi:hypothetical protein